MQRHFRNLAVALVAGTFAVAAGAQDKAAPAKPKADSAAPKKAASASARIVVNGVTIPQSRVDAMNKELNMQGQPDNAERQNAVREELVNREILAQAAAKRGLDKNPDIQAQMDMARQAVLVRALFESEVKTNPITDADLQKQYEQFKGSMGTNEYKVAHILVDKEEDAKQIIDALNKGGDFAKIAKERSKDPGSKENGGDLDWGPSARYVKPFSDAVTTQPKGKISAAPVKTDFGYHVIRVDDVRTAEMPKFEDIKPQIAQQMEQQKMQEYQKGLRDKAKVQ
jgi:peptidyl-prolyl cis-trans isomerase C